MNPRNQSSYIVTFLLIVAVAAMVFMMVQRDTTSEQSLTINQLADDIKLGKISRVVINDDDSLRVVYTSGSEQEAEAYKEAGSTLVEQLIALGVSQEQLSPTKVKIEVKPPSQWASFLTSALYILPVLLMAGFLWFVFRQAQGSNNAAMSFGKSRARMFSGEHPTVTFQDVAGAEESKQELAEVVEFLKEPQKFIQLGARIPKGVLLVGPPHRQDSSCKSSIWRSGRSILLDLRF
ncbi:MAG: hypothetical protein U0X93_02555 [Anaerolineales bacterium]